ncbi:hypothetical protein [Defluviitalea saccharophila]|uniref:Holin n=1 Tax=Defluviitalea saccharophila TaxID=879970 RepID=A0ABZ2Y6F4_9FIRM|nr:hypothetical protein [Candidatus Epulonipiscium sp.]NLM12823.1 hypothetical protein [Candidatus Epulonipiscium sp.]
MNPFGLFMISFLTESVVEIIKDIIPKRIWDKTKKYIPVAISIFLAVGYKIDFFCLLEMEFSIPYTGYILSGLIASRGANYVHNFLGHKKVG